MPAAMYKGDTRTRTLDIYVDDVLETTWTSSGTTTDFETVKLGFFTTDSTSGGGGYDYSHVGVAGSKVELVGDLVASEWLSILEVCDGFRFFLLTPPNTFPASEFLKRICRARLSVQVTWRGMVCCVPL